MHPENYLPIVEVLGLVVAKDEEVLLLRSHWTCDRYSAIFGQVHLGEYCKDAFIRVVRETVGLELDRVEHICTLESLFSPDYEVKSHRIIYGYVGFMTELQHKEDISLLLEESNAIWLPSVLLKDLLLTKETEELLLEYERKKKANAL